MADNDVYNNKRKYEGFKCEYFIQSLTSGLKEPTTFRIFAFLETRPSDRRPRRATCESLAIHERAIPSSVMRGVWFLLKPN